MAKPEHFARHYAEQFQDSGVATADRHRVPYPAEAFAILAGLMVDEPRVVLDVGCGTGAIAQNLIARAERVVKVVRIFLVPRGN